MIKKDVGTRDVTNIRAHGQKFLLKLVKDLDSNLEGSSEYISSKYFHDVLTGKATKMHTRLNKIQNSAVATSENVMGNTN